MNTNIIRFPGMHDPREKAGKRAEEKIREILGNTPTAKIFGKIVKISIRNTPT